jgi:hypothetical protein
MANTVVYESTATFNAGDDRGTVKTLTVAAPSSPRARYLVAVYNPGAVPVRALCKAVETISSSARASVLANELVPASAQGVTVFSVEEPFARDSFTVELIAAADVTAAFTVTVRIREAVIAGSGAGLSPADSANIAATAEAANDASPVPIIAATATPIDRSGTIAAANTSQLVMAAAERPDAAFYNISDTTMWARWGGAASIGGAGSFPVGVGAPIPRLNVIPNTALHVICAAAGKAFTAWEYPPMTAAALARHPAYLFFRATYTTQGWIDMPAAETEWNGSSSGRLIANLAHFTKARLGVHCGSVLGAVGATLRVRYSLDNGATWANLAQTGTLSTPIDANANRPRYGNTVDIAAAAKNADVLLQVTGMGGDGAIDPNFGNIWLELIP